jgi:hypothetical protein
MMSLQKPGGKLWVSMNKITRHFETDVPAVADTMSSIHNLDHCEGRFVDFFTPQPGDEKELAMEVELHNEAKKD